MIMNPPNHYEHDTNLKPIQINHLCETFDKGKGLVLQHNKTTTFIKFQRNHYPYIACNQQCYRNTNI